MKENKPEYKSVATITYKGDIKSLTKEECKLWKGKLWAKAKINVPRVLDEEETLSWTTHIIFDDKGNPLPDEAYTSDVKVIKE